MNMLITAVTPYIEMFIWFIVLYAFGLFSTPLAPLFSIIVLMSPLIDKGMVYILKTLRGLLYEKRIQNRNI